MQSYNQINFHDVPADELINYIVNKHHAFAKNMITLCKEHSNELKEAGEEQADKINSMILSLERALLSHFRDEEEILYPYAKMLLAWERKGSNKMIPSVNIIENPINRFIEEHKNLLKLLGELRIITEFYTVSSNNKHGLKLLHAELFELDQDIQKQIYLENNILFTKLIALEKQAIQNKPHS